MSNDQFRQTIFSQAKKKGNQARILGAFVEAALINSGRTRADFAGAMQMEDDLVDGLLDGELPDSLISEELLVDIARVIQYDANLLRVMLGRKPNRREAHH